MATKHPIAILQVHYKKESLEGPIVQTLNWFPEGRCEMLRCIRWATAFALTLFVGTYASADEYDSRMLFRKGAWVVELTHNTKSGNLWCEAQTSNKYNQSFTIVAYDNATLALFVIDHGWNIAERPIRFLVDIDYSRWTMDGTGSGISVSLQLDDAEKSYKFLSELMAGSAVAVLNANERRIATFSLSGSFAATTKLFECWSQISNSDPFSNPSDPFTGRADPF